MGNSHKSLTPSHEAYKAMYIYHQKTVDKQPRETILNKGVDYNISTVLFPIL